MTRLVPLAIAVMLVIGTAARWNDLPPVPPDPFFWLGAAEWMMFLCGPFALLAWAHSVDERERRTKAEAAARGDGTPACGG